MFFSFIAKVVRTPAEAPKIDVVRKQLIKGNTSQIPSNLLFLSLLRKLLCSKNFDLKFSMCY